MKVWKADSMIYYGEQLARDVNLPKPYADYIDDPLQMAGNVIFDSDAQVVFIHASKYPADRPSVEDMLNVLEKL